MTREEGGVVTVRPREIQVLPVAHSIEDIVVGGQKYEILRYEKGKGPTLAETIDIGKARGNLMLTREDADRIQVNTSTQEPVFRSALKPEEWGFIRDHANEQASRGRARAFGYTGQTFPFDSDRASIAIFKVETTPTLQLVDVETLRTAREQFGQLRAASASTPIDTGALEQVLGLAGKPKPRA